MYSVASVRVFSPMYPVYINWIHFLEAGGGGRRMGVGVGGGRCCRCCPTSQQFLGRHARAPST